MKTIWADSATEQVFEIAEYIAHNSPSNALKWLDSIYEKADSLREFPYKFPEAEEAFNTQIRDCTFGRFRIIYKVDAKIIYVMAVKRCAQDKTEDEINEI